MSQLKPLLFLTYRSLWNGLKRAATTPRRLLSFLAVLGYYFLVMVRPALVAATPQPEFPSRFVGIWQFPALSVLDAFVFGLFLASSLIFVSTLRAQRASFSPADADVLFATPLSPKAVLCFRMARDYLFTLLAPLFVAILSLRVARAGWEKVFREMPHPEYSGLTLRMMTVSWLLMALCFVSLSYAVYLYVNRSDARSKLRGFVVDGAIIVFELAWIPYLVWRIVQHHDPNSLVALAESPFLRLVFFLASFATEVTLSPFTGNFGMAVVGVAGLLGTIAIGMILSLRQVGWMYDQAATRGFGSLKSRQLQRSGDFAGLMAERARSGKLRPPRMRILRRFRTQGAAALVWKELFLLSRTMAFPIVLLGLIQLALDVSSGFMSPLNAKIAGYTLIAMQGFCTMMLTLMLGQTGFIEVLKRVDLEKPLPFSARNIVFYEIVARATPAILIAWIGLPLAAILDPRVWQFALGGFILSPVMALMLTATTFLITILFPDLEDSSQRQLRALMTLLAYALAASLPVLATLGLFALGLNAVICCAVGAVFALGIAFLAATAGAHLYAGFNPAE